jgi:hypothetical protein
MRKELKKKIDLIERNETKDLNGRNEIIII